MGPYNRRTFLKCSAMLTATAAASRIFIPPAVGQAAFNPVTVSSVETLVPGDSVRQGQGQKNVRNQQGSDHPFFKNAKRPEVIAHRGGNGQWPGETMYAYQQAVNIGVDILEMDVHSTSDGKLVLMHNDTVDDTTNGKGCIRTFTWDKLKKLDAGYEWSADCEKTFPFRGLGIRVPLLEEVLNAFPNMRMNIEIKQSDPSIVEPFCKMIQGHKDRVLVASFKDSVLQEFRSQLPEVATSASACELLESITKDTILKKFSPQLAVMCKLLQSVKVSQCKSKKLVVNHLSLPPGSPKQGIDAIQVPGLMGQQLIKDFVDKAHDPSVNLQVHAWTINEPKNMRKMIAAGVDGIITDYPGPLLALLGRTQPV